MSLTPKYEAIRHEISRNLSIREKSAEFGALDISVSMV
jgi:hypothetical protein